MRFLIFLVCSTFLPGLAGYCMASHHSTQSDQKAAMMAAVRTLLLNNYNDTEPAVSTTIGARQIRSTPVEQGTLFASPEGSLETCSRDTPCSIRIAFTQLGPGDILFLRGGTYDVTMALRPGDSGLVDNPIVIESFPGETAVLEGHYRSAGDVANNPNGRTSGIRLGKDHSYIVVRNIEAKHMGWAGISVYGSHNIVEGCHTHDNIISGIALYGGEWHEDHDNYQIPYPYGYNIIRDNISNANSDIGLPANGGNSDGIAISSGRHNTIIHNTVYANSDDGIDTWRSNDSFVAFNRVYDNGRGDGNGNGIKAGGNLNPDASNGLRAVVKHNLVYDNRERGLDYNAGHYVVFQYNTSFRNGTVGVHGVANTRVEYNIASHNGSQNSQLGTNNSWNIQEQITFLSIDPHSADFLKPEAGSPFDNMGAYANLTANGEAKNRKAEWINEAFTAIEKNHYPRIKAVSWWHENFDGSALRMDSSPSSLRAYRGAVSGTAFLTSPVFSSNILMEPPSGFYHSAFPDFGGTEDIVTEERIKDFEDLAGKEIIWAYFSNNWLTSIQFPAAEVEIIHSAGKVPFIRMMPRSSWDEGGPDSVYTMQRIIDGDFDTLLNEWAINARNSGIPLLVEFGTEVNGNWFPWNGQYNGDAVATEYGDPNQADGPERFRDAYRHIIDICNNNNADNITWFYHVDAYSEPDVSWNSVDLYYPGDNYIDWIGLSVYGPQQFGEEYQSFTEIMDDIYPKISAFSNKPVAILEFAITEL